MKKQQTKANKLYQKAVVGAARAGYSHDAGLANERYATYMLELCDKAEAKHRLEEASRFYKQWGAARKVEIL